MLDYSCAALYHFISKLSKRDILGRLCERNSFQIQRGFSSPHACSMGPRGFSTKIAGATDSLHQLVFVT